VRRRVISGFWGGRGGLNLFFKRPPEELGAVKILVAHKGVHELHERHWYPRADEHALVSSVGSAFGFSVVHLA